jgi:hypothetical protein
MMASLARLNAMSAAWDIAAGALMRRDYPAFDQAMSKFREASTRERGDGNASSADQ